MEEVEDTVNIPAMVESLMFVKVQYKWQHINQNIVNIIFFFLQEKMANIDNMFKDRDRTRPLRKFMKPSFRTEIK